MKMSNIFHSYKTSIIGICVMLVSFGASAFGVDAEVIKYTLSSVGVIAGGALCVARDPND